MPDHEESPTDGDAWTVYARSLVEAFHGPVMVYGTDGVIVDVNSAAIDLTGRGRDTLIGSSRPFEGPQNELMWQSIREAFRRGSLVEYPVTFVAASGEPREFIYNAVVLRDGAGSVSGVVALGRDVTEEKRIQAELARERDRLQSVLGSARLGTWEWDMRTDEGVVDDRFAEIIGYTRQELTPSSNDLWLKLTHPDDIPLEQEATERHIAGIDEYYDVETRMLHQDGSWVWVRDRGKIVEWDEAGRPLRMTGTLEDVTQAREDADRLAAAEEQFRLAMDQSTIGMCLVEPDGRFRRVNPALCTMFGRSETELTATTWQELTHPDDLEMDLDLVKQTLNGTIDGYRLLKRYLNSAGGVVWGDLSVAIVRNPDKSGRYFISQIVDVTDRQKAEQQLAEREELLRVVLDNSPDPTVRFNSEMRIEYVNEVTGLATGIARDEWIGARFDQLGFPQEVVGRWEEYGRRVFVTGDRIAFEFTTDTPRGERYVEATMAPELHADGTVAHVIATIHDLTRRRRAEADLLRLATHDPLTGLSNRAVLADELARAMQTATRTGHHTAVLMVDLDRFKNVNDSLGHGTGDELLRAAAKRMQGAVRQGDLIARTGGDEFVVVMRELDDTDEAQAVAAAIVEQFRSPFTIDQQELYTTASIGVALAASLTSADDLVREADTAMYVAKAEGRDRVVVYNQQLRAAVTARLAIESELRQALERDELEVWYQPEVDLRSGEVTAMEALLRWNTANGEMRPAEAFIEVAEETGLITTIGAWVLSRACGDAVQWATSPGGREVVVRVNVSARQLAEPDLLAVIEEALSATGLPARLLCLEITETTLLRSSYQAAGTLEAARRLGVAIALDDFGTGYASLAYLREYPFDMLKIDRSFITRITTLDLDRHLVAGILAIAAQLELDVTAEGVEHPEQAACLRELGCRGAQGYLFSEAIPRDDVAGMLASGFAVV